MSEVDYEALPVSELLSNKAWKARQVGYSKLKQIAEKNLKDDQVVDLINDIEALRNIAADANMVSQEAGVDLLLYILRAADPKSLNRSKEQVVPALVEKGLMSSKASTKTNSTELILLYIEVLPALEVIELIIPSLSAKSPKLIIAAIKVLNEIYTEFGCLAVNPKIIIDNIPKMFAHSDKNVRAEATKLCVTIRSYVGQSLDTVIFPKLKPIQQKDLTALFDKIEPGVTPKRLLLSEKLKLEADERKKLQVSNTENFNANADDDIEMADHDSVERERKPVFDPNEFEDPVDVLSKIPTDIADRLTNPVWKERVEALETITPIFKVSKYQNDDYSYFVSLMVGCLRDVNLQVLTMACGILSNMAKGLKSNFSKYISTLINPLLERTKEKKKPVLDALNEVLDLCFEFGSFDEIVDPIVEHMKHISPPVKVETMSYCVRCLKKLTVKPNAAHVDTLMLQGIKLLQDSQLPVRNGASEVISTLMKIIGPEASKKYMDKVDKRHVKKIEQLCQNAIVIVSNNSTAAGKLKDNFKPEKTIKPSRSEISNSSNSAQNIPSMPPVTSYDASIPSKRAATSPIKDNVPNTKNTLTSRSLKTSTAKTYGATNQQLEELEALKAEKQEWISLRKEMQVEIEELRKNNNELLRNVVSLNDKIDAQHNKYTTMSMSLKSKDTQIFRLKSDIENMSSRNLHLQQKLKLVESQYESLKKLRNSNINVNVDKPEVNSNVDVSMDESTEINRRISILSIDSKTGEPREYSDIPKVLEPQNSTLYNIDDKDDGWIRATAITNDLKAKIQRMKARTRTLGSADE